MTNEELLHKAYTELSNSIDTIFDMQESKIGINDGIALAYQTCGLALSALQELKNRSEGVEPPKQG